MTDSSGESRPNASHSKRSESETTKTRSKLPVSRRDALATILGLGGLSLVGSEAARGLPHGGGHGGGGQQPLPDISDDGTKVVQDVVDINFGVNLAVTDDGDSSVTVDASPWEQATDAAGFSLSDLGSLTMSDNGMAITDFAGTNLSIDGSGLLNATDTHTAISDDDSEVVGSTGDINFGTNLDVTDDGDGSVTVDGVDTGEANDGSNIGSGADVYAGKNGSTLEFRRLSGSGTVFVAQSGGTVTIHGEVPPDPTHGENLGSGAGVYAGKSGPKLAFRSLIGVNGIQVYPTGSGEIAVENTQSPSPWDDGDGDGLLEAPGFDGIDVSQVHTPWVGTIASTPLEAYVEGKRVLRIEPQPSPIHAPNVIFGNPNNNAESGVVGGVIGGGGGGDGPNTVKSPFDAIVSGFDNTVDAGFSVIAGGRGNTIDVTTSPTSFSPSATIAGGIANEARASRTAVGGGRRNTASGAQATVPGGQDNTASGQFSFAAGHKATAQHDGAFVFGDSSNSGIQSQNADEVRSQMAMYAPSFNTTSARAKKEAIEPVAPDAVLDAVVDLDVNTWEFKHNGDGRHMGPMAEDFRDAFGLGDGDGHIASVDADGVLFAAVQGLSAKLDEKSDRIDELERENEVLRDRYASLEERLAHLEAEVRDTDHA